MKATAIPLVESTVFAEFTDAEWDIIRGYLDVLTYAEDVEVVREGEASDALYVVMKGQAQVHRGSMTLSSLTSGQCFGELGLMSAQPRAGSVKAVTPLTLLRLSDTSVAEISKAYPHLTEKLYRNVATILRQLLTDMTDTVATLLEQRARPLRAEVQIRLGDEMIYVASGTPIVQALPEQVDGEPVIAALINSKSASLNTPVYASASIEPITRRDACGRGIYRRSVGLLLLEAASRLDPNLAVHIGPSLGFAHIVEVESTNGWERAQLAKELTAEMRRMVEADTLFRRERWTTEEARAHFELQGWGMVVRLLRTWRNRTAALVSCGDYYALEIGPTVPSAGRLSEFEVVDFDNDLLLYFGDETRRSHDVVRAAHPGRMARRHENWLNTMGATSVGAFNDICISGKVSRIIRVSEGFHEKRISDISDQIAHQEDTVRVICIAGPSSSGKTTFIKRLSVQLQVNGITPHWLSLDDYYVDRERTPRDEDGDYDYEAFDALDASLMAEHLGRLAKGDPVKTAHYDFQTGKSHANGGRDMHVGEGEVLLVEGIHALNPKLPIDQDKGVFRIFINPMSSLPLDHLTRVSVSDIRLLRRIVRDRFQRAITAADNIMRWPSVSRGERTHIFPYQERAHAVFNSSLIYELSVLKVYAERYLLEVPEDHPAYTVAYRLRRLMDRFVSIYPDHVPPTSLLREFIGGIGFDKK